MLSFIVVVILMFITPGPGVLSLAGTGAAFGWRQGLRYMAGLWVGHFLVSLAVITGLATIISAEPLNDQSSGGNGTLDSDSDSYSDSDSDSDSDSGSDDPVSIDFGSGGDAGSPQVVNRPLLFKNEWRDADYQLLSGPNFTVVENAINRFGGFYVT